MESQVPINLAREQRKPKNPWEAKLWIRLRNRKFYNFKFKRQVRIGFWIYDFCCNEKKLVIELEVKENDKNKENYAFSQGYKVLRFQNIDLGRNLEGVLEEIRKNLLNC